MEEEHAATVIQVVLAERLIPVEHSGVWPGCLCQQCCCCSACQQAHFRRYCARKHYKKQKAAAVRIQIHVGSFLSRRQVGIWLQTASAAARAAHAQTATSLLLAVTECSSCMVAVTVQVAKDEEQQQRAARFKAVMARHTARIQVC
jgi:hypothetical protein